MSVAITKHQQQQGGAVARRRAPGVLSVQVGEATVTVDAPRMIEDLRHARNVARNYRADGMLILPAVGTLLRAALLLLGLLARTPSLPLLQLALLALELPLVVPAFFALRFLEAVIVAEGFAFCLEAAHFVVWAFFWGGLSLPWRYGFAAAAALTAMRLAVTAAFMVAAASAGAAVLKRDHIEGTLHNLRNVRPPPPPASASAPAAPLPDPGVPPTAPPRPSPVPASSSAPPPLPPPSLAAEQQPPQEEPSLVQAVIEELTTHEAGAAVADRVRAGFKID